MSPPRKTKVFVVAGEASADLHASCLLRELKTMRDIESFGVGGEKLRSVGMDVVVEASDLNILGFVDWWDGLGSILKKMKRLEKEIAERKPDIAILLDLPDFNLTLAPKIKRLGIPLVYYISPQVWAWRKYRIRKIRRLVDKMLVLFPFEKEFYKKANVEVEFVGHPLLDQIEPRYEYRGQEAILKAPRIAILPGSRPKELRFHAPVLSEVMTRLKSRYPAATFKIPVASTLTAQSVESAFAAVPGEIVSGSAIPVLNWADYAIVASGTATLETALAGTPFSILYKVSAVNAFLKERVFRYQGFFGMPNLLLSKEVVPEFFQEEANANQLTQEAIRILENSEARQTMIGELKKCRDLLGSKGASRRVAVEVLKTLGQTTLEKGATLEYVPVPT